MKWLRAIVSIATGAAIAIVVFGLVVLGPGMVFFINQYLEVHAARAIDDTPVWATLIAAPLTVPGGGVLGLCLGGAVGFRFFKRSRSRSD